MKKLNDYMKANNINCRQLSERLKVNRGTVYSWSLGKTQPGVRVAVKLEHITRNFVSVYDWK